MSASYVFLYSIQSGWTALHAAAHKGHLRVIEKLLDAKADVNIKTNVSVALWHCIQLYLNILNSDRVYITLT